jgi:hypothetical protein
MGERGFKKGTKVEKEDQGLGINYDLVATDDRDSFFLHLRETTKE